MAAIILRDNIKKNNNERIKFSPPQFSGHVLRYVTDSTLCILQNTLQNGCLAKHNCFGCSLKNLADVFYFRFMFSILTF